MPRRFFRRYMPSPERIRNDRWLRMFGKVLHQPNLWHLNRTSVSRAFAIGLFWAMMPMPFQMIPAAACAIKFKANVALSAALVWISNPFTMPALMYAGYRVGRTVLGLPPRGFGLDFEALRANLGEIWQPLLLGSLLLGIVAGSAGYLALQWFWRWNISRKWHRRERITAIALRMTITPPAAGGMSKSE